jgi:hypothetical protein
MRDAACVVVYQYRTCAPFVQVLLNRVINCLAKSVALISIHQPLVVQGTAIKTNNNQRYATNAETGFLLRELARRAGVPVQVGQLTSSLGGSSGQVGAADWGGGRRSSGPFRAACQEGDSLVQAGQLFVGRELRSR